MAKPGLPTDFSNSFKSAELFEKFPDQSLQHQKCFTWDEVSTFNGVDGAPLCIVFEDSVYNITDFARYHPGGPSCLKQYGGRDAGAAMRGTTMPPYVFDAMKRFRAGYVVPHGSSC